MATLDPEAGRHQAAAAHLRQALQILMRAGSWYELINGLEGCGRLCAATRRYSEVVTIWSAYAALCRRIESADWPADARFRQRYERKARQAMDPAEIRAAEQRGAAMPMSPAAGYGA